jgi:hypothetical protein
MEADLLQSVIEEPPVKPARASSSTQNKPQQQKKQRALSMGFALNSNANFYDIPVVGQDSFIYIYIYIYISKVEALIRLFIIERCL